MQRLHYDSLCLQLRNRLGHDRKEVLNFSQVKTIIMYKLYTQIHQQLLTKVLLSNEHII